MGEEVTTPQNEEDLDWDDLLGDFEPEAEQEEKKLDGEIVKLAKNQRKIAERQARMEAQAERDKLVGDFYAHATDEAKQFADVFLAGVTEPDKVKKMLDLAQAKAKAVTPEAPDEEEDDGDVEKALSTPLESAGMAPKDPAKERAERTKNGDLHAAFIEFMDAPATGGIAKSE